jgi:transposase
VTIVMGLDQHRARITAEWLDTATGEVARKRIAPGDRGGVRRFAAVFRGQPLEVALEATTGWRFVVEELQAIGAGVHLAEPAETAARRGTKKRAKSDRADARDLRELLMVGRLPESWIAPEHLLDLRARVRLRHTLVDQRRECQQRIQATLYHHGVPPRSWLLGAESRAWLASLRLPPAAREQITVALALIDGPEAQLAPLDAALRALAKRQPGCRALMRYYGIGPLTSVTILAELGDARRFSSSREAVRYSGWTSPSTSPTRAAHPAACPDRGRQRCAGRSSKPPNALAAHAHRTTTTTSRRPPGSAATAPAWPSRASRSSAATTPCANSARRRCSQHDPRSTRAALTHTDAPRPAPGMLPPPPPHGRPS